MVAACGVLKTHLSDSKTVSSKDLVRSSAHVLFVFPA